MHWFIGSSTPGQVVWQRGPVVRQEEGVVAEGAHGDTHLQISERFFLSIRFKICRHLCEVVEVLDHRGLQRICYAKKKKESVNLSEKQSVRDGLAHHEGGDKVLNSARLSTVGAEVERVETSEQAGEMKYF